MTPPALLVVAMHLALQASAHPTCWPFEIGGQGAADTVPPAPEPPGVPLPAPTPAVVAPRLPAPVTTVRPPLPPPPPSLPLFEEARYDVRYGILGTVGELRFAAGGLAEHPDGSRIVSVRGTGAGAVVGLGGMERQIEADFDPAVMGSRRWTVRRFKEGQPASQATVDTAMRARGGVLHLERTKPGPSPGAPPSHEMLNLTFAVPTSDPLGLLWRLRTAPPAAGKTEVLQLLDGLALWRVRVTTAGAKELLPEAAEPALRLDGEVAPIRYDGQPDPERPTRTFTLWLAEGASHLPLRLEVPFGLADIVMTLAETRKLVGTVAPARAPSTNGGGQAPGRAASDKRAADPAVVRRQFQLTGPAPGARIL